MASAMGAEVRSHSVWTARKDAGVLTESVAITISDGADLAAILSRFRIAARPAVSIPSSHRAKRSAGGPPVSNPPAPPTARGTNTRPLNYLGCISGRTALYSLPVLAEERKDALENQY